MEAVFKHNFCLQTLPPTLHSLILHLTGTSGFVWVSFSKKPRGNKPLVQKGWCQRFILCHFQCVSIFISAGAPLAAARDVGAEMDVGAERDWGQRWMWGRGSAGWEQQRTGWTAPEGEQPAQDKGESTAAPREEAALLSVIKCFHGAAAATIALTSGNFTFMECFFQIFQYFSEHVYVYIGERILL